MDREEFCNLIAEELKLCMGFDVEVCKDRRTWKLKIDTIAGVYIFIPQSDQNVMFNVYRFISNYGGKLQYWGLQSKISEYKI